MSTKKKKVTFCGSNYLVPQCRDWTSSLHQYGYAKLREDGYTVEMMPIESSVAKQQVDANADAENLKRQLDRIRLR